MFTGIIEEMGTLVEFSPNGNGAHLVIEADTVMSDMTIGASVAVNGCCFTVIDIGDHRWSTEAVPETLDRTGIGRLEIGSAVNLERPVAADGRFGGHIVQGHVDGLATVASIDEMSDGSHLVRFALGGVHLPYIVEKGSVTVDGVSLTVAALRPDGFDVAVIPHTWTVTRFGTYLVGSAVNIEVDILAKYVERLLAGGAGTTTPIDPTNAEGQTP